VLNFGILLKSYDKDFDLAERLIGSFNLFNPEQLRMFIVVPDSDLQKFQIFESETISVLSESLLGQYLVDHEVAGIRPGYINQEIVKLSFWELELTENYFCVDSDAVFIRPLSIDDFMFDESTPYTVLVEDNELKSEPKYFEQHWKGREPQLRRIQQILDLKDRRILTCHGHQVFSGAVLGALKSNFMDPRAWSYKDLLAESPYEFSWYNMWIQKCKMIPIQVREPLVKTFHNEDQHMEFGIRGMTLHDLSRSYIGVVLNSNFATAYGSEQVEEPLSETLARYVQPSVLFRALVSQATMSFSKRIRGKSPGGKPQ
jgi:hypothetical protein